MPSLKTRLVDRFHRMRRGPRRAIVAFAVVVVVLLMARIALPIVLKSAVNHRLQRIPGYSGRVEDVDVHLWRGAYSMQEFDIRKQSGDIEAPFIYARDIDFSLAWRELLRGKVVSNIRIAVGQITFVVGPDEAQSQTDVDKRWQDVIEALFPIDITHLEITDGLLRYINTAREPRADVFITHMHATATGLRNRPGEESDGEFPASIRIDGESLGGGRLEIVLDADPLAREPHFHLSLKLDAVELTALNETLMAYAGVDVSGGTFRLVAEMAANDGGFRGYVKPFFEDLDFESLPGQEQNLGHQLWEALVAFVTTIVKNKSRDQLATRVPFEGRFGDPKFGLLATIGNVFRHGFIQAFTPTIENSIDPEAIEPDGDVDPADAAREQNKADQSEVENP